MRGPELRPGLVLLLCLLCYVSSLEAALAFLSAAMFHELGHILAIRLCGRQILSVRAEGWGAVLLTETMPPGQELACALAGPLFSLLLLPLGRFFPVLALFALAQCAYNLLPIYPMDGGRALYCALQLGLSQETAWETARLLGIAAGSILAALGVFGAIFLHYGILPAVFGGIFFYRVLGLWRNK